MSSANILTFAICLAVFVCTFGLEQKCPGRHGLWDKWYDGCNWCVCSEFGPICTNKSCYRIPVDQCEPLNEKWRDGCYKCECKDSGIECQADTRCLHAISSTKRFPRTSKLGCVCGIDDVPSCVADTEYLEMMYQILRTKGHKEKSVPNESRVSKTTKKMSCRYAKRYYSGSRRCFCEDRDSEPQCSSPRHIAHRVDSFRFKPFRCDKVQRWTFNCRSCVCDVQGFSFCVRIRGCKKDLISVSHHKSENAECKVGAKWTDGCRKCLCSSHSRIICDMSDCNGSGTIAETRVNVIEPTVKLGEEKIKLTGDSKPKDDVEGSSLPKPEGGTKISSIRKFQFPPPRTSVHMVRSFRTRGPKGGDDISQILCDGKYTPGQTFYDDCNFCTCTHTGESTCTAILCV